MANVSDSVAVRRNHGAIPDDLYYEVWLVESPKVEDYLVALDRIVEQSYHLTPTGDERKEILVRTARVQNATISAYEGK